MTMLPFGQIAPISRRAVAYLIDAVIAGGLAIVLGVVLALVVGFSGSIEASIATLAVGGPIVGLLMLAWFLVYTWMQAGAGSIGMRAQGLALVRESDGAPLGFGRALLRNVIFGLAAGVVVGYFTPLFDGSGRFQGWHDKVATSVMLDARVSGGAGRAVAASRRDTPPAPRPEAPSPAIPGIPHPTDATAAPQTSRFSAPTASGAPQPPLPAPAPVSAQPPAPAFPAPAAPAFPAASPAAPVGSADDLIAFVPGITQDAAPARATPPSADSAPATPGAPAPAAAPATPEAPAPVAAAPATPATPEAPAPAVPAPAPAPAPAPVAAAAETDIESTRISIPGHRLILTWDDGTRVAVSRRTIFGRNPTPEDGATVVPVRDETLSLSKTHFEAAAEVSGGWVLDRHSTNGTTIVRDGQRLACPAGQRVPVRLGDAIEIGDRIVTIGGYA